MIRLLVTRAAVGFAKLVWVGAIVAAVSIVVLGFARAAGLTGP